MRVQVESTGIYVPPLVETATDLVDRVGKDEDWIVSRTGVLARHVCREPVEAMAAKAARRALGDGPEPDLILNASATPRQAIPDTSVFVQQELGFDGIPSHTVHATCLSFTVALHTAAAFIHAGTYRRILIVSSEIGTVGRNFEEPESAVLLGDGAAAAVVVPTPAGSDSELIAYRMTTHPRGAKLTEVPGGGVHQHPNRPEASALDNYFTMDGPGIYRMARRRVAILLRDVLNQAGLADRDAIDLVVPHQASGMAVKAVSRYGFPPEKVVNVVAQYGNTIAASLPMALAHANAEGRLQRGNRVLLVGTGAGLSVAAAILRW